MKSQASKVAQVPFPLYLWDTRQHKPESIVTDESMLTGTIEYGDSVGAGYILLDAQGLRWVIETDICHDIVRIECLDTEPLDSSLELLNLIKIANPPQFELPKATVKERWKMLTGFLKTQK